MTEGASGTAPEAPRRQGMSTGAKVFFGCLALSFVGILGIAAAVLVGGMALWRGADSAVATLEEQRDAGETLRRIEEEHPFEPPEDGVVDEDRLERFLAVTDDAWEEMRPWAEDLEELRVSAGEEGGGVARLGELAAGARAMGGLARSRVALAGVLEEHGMSLGEYTWTGLTLARAAEVRDGEARSGVPAANVELAARNAGRIPTLDDSGRGVVLAVASLWGLTQLSTWRAMGLDTLMAR